MVTVFVTRPAGGDVAEDPNRTVLERCAEEAEVANPRRAEVDVHADEESQGRDLGGEGQVLQGPQYRKLMASSSAMTKVLLSAILVALAVAYWYGSSWHYYIYCLLEFVRCGYMWHLRMQQRCGRPKARSS